MVDLLVRAPPEDCHVVNVFEAALERIVGRGGAVHAQRALGRLVIEAANGEQQPRQARFFGIRELRHLMQLPKEALVLAARAGVADAGGEVTRTLGLGEAVRRAARAGEGVDGEGSVVP